VVRLPGLGALRRAPLPPERENAWTAFLRCAHHLDEGRSVLLATLPVGRIDPAPIALGTAAVRTALGQVTLALEGWRIPELDAEWQRCRPRAVDEARGRLETIDRIAATTDELDHVLEEVRELMEDLEPFADAEAAFRARWRLPREAGDGRARG
jgi:hypothetical protein